MDGRIAGGLGTVVLNDSALASVDDESICNGYRYLYEIIALFDECYSESRE